MTDNLKSKGTDLNALNQAFQPESIQAELFQQEKLPTFGACMLNAAKEMFDTWKPTSRDECVAFASNFVRADDVMADAYKDFA